MLNLPLSSSMELTKLEKKRGVWIQILWMFILLVVSQAIPLLFRINTDETTSTGFINSLLSQICPIIVVVLYCRFVEKRSAKSLGFYKEGFFKQTGIGILIGIVMMSGVFILNLLTKSINVTSNIHSVSWVFVIMTFFGFMIQGLSEEVLFRGYLMNSFASKGALVAIIVNTILFALLHGANSSISIIALINLILAGLIYSLLFYLTNNIWLLGACHALWNYMQGPIFGLKVSGHPLPSSVLLVNSFSDKTLFNGGDFGFEGGLGVLIISIITTVILVVLIKNKLNTKSSI